MGIDVIQICCEMLLMAREACVEVVKSRLIVCWLCAGGNTIVMKVRCFAKTGTHLKELPPCLHYNPACCSLHIRLCVHLAFANRLCHIAKACSAHFLAGLY